MRHLQQYMEFFIVWMNLYTFIHIPDSILAQYKGENKKLGNLFSHGL